MSICKKRKIIYIHGSKCGGKSIENCVFGFEPMQKSVHKSIDQYSREVNIDKYFVFTFVRNPWERVVSMFFDYINRINPGSYKKEEFLKAFRDSYENKNGFLFDHTFSGPVWELISINDDVKCDFIGNFDNFEKEFEKLKKLSKIEDNIKLPLINKGKYKKHYSKYYDEYTIQKVSEIYKKDIEIFNFSFDDRRDK
jgi:hypothetical protein